MASEEDLRSQYDRALDEYRFQVDLNWRRSEYFFVLNIGVLIASATMFSSGNVPRELVFVLFLVGALLAGLSFLANGVQHGYYRAARERKKKLEDRLNLSDIAIATTPGMGSTIARLGKVGTFLKIMLVAIAVADLVGAGFAITDAVSSPQSPARDPRVVVRIRTGKLEKTGPAQALVVSQNHELIRSRRVRPGGVLLALPPGTYDVSIAGKSLCKRRIDVSDQPLQIEDVNCW